ncbi:hypothetical protein GXM_08847 [Nostoc sphaeroides CCNUC1]|uniref:Uncharacterized protein n=1 Tax=Nostoc sphaeroides CCNUC1 TaxID=2653204 RepID=A0A5P8WEV9_9NOSO|nr:hypothetical protein GXM_08847 [Nostoc sphaeroides CCNUC1]
MSLGGDEAITLLSLWLVNPIHNSYIRNLSKMAKVSRDQYG